MLIVISFSDVHFFRVFIKFQSYISSAFCLSFRTRAPFSFARWDAAELCLLHSLRHVRAQLKIEPFHRPTESFPSSRHKSSGAGDSVRTSSSNTSETFEFIDPSMDLHKW